MNFPVPWRCLLPGEAAEFVLYNQGAVLRELSARTGAAVDVSGDADTPKRLSDRIVTISGQAEQKEAACRGVVGKLRKLQDLNDPRDLGFFVLVVPANAIPVVVGQKGGTIQEILASAEGVEMSIGKENIMSMPDVPIGLEGTTDQVVAAAVAIHKVVQEMADRGRLMPSDFKYRPGKQDASAGFPEVCLPPVEHDQFGGLDPAQNFRTKAKLVIDSTTAGWLIGKGGRTIREMQENSGAFLHILREEESPAPVALRPGDRIVEICGRYERKLEGIMVVLRTADSMPNEQAPKDTLMLVPNLLAEPAVLQEASQAFGCHVTVESSAPGHEETIIRLAGSTSARIQAAQNFLTRTDRAHMDGTVVALSVDGELVGRDGRPRKEVRDTMQWGGQADGRRAESQPPPRTRPPSAAAAPPERRDFEASSGAGQPAPAVQSARDQAWATWEARERAASQDTRPQAPKFPEGYNPNGPAARLRTQSPEARVPVARHTAVLENQRADPPRQPLVSEPMAALAVADQAAAPPPRHEPRPELPAAGASHQRETPSHFSDAAPAADPMPRHGAVLRGDSPKSREVPATARPAVSWSDDFRGPRGSHAGPPPEAQAPGGRAPAPGRGDEESSVAGSATSSDHPYEQRLLQEGPLERLEAAQRALAPAPGRPAADPHPGPRTPGMPGTGCDPAVHGVAEATLASNAQLAHVPSKLVLELPEAELREVLIPRVFQDVARRCQVQIDLATEVRQQRREVLLTGTVLSNAAAAYWIQVGLAQGG